MKSSSMFAHEKGHPMRFLSIVYEGQVCSNLYHFTTAQARIRFLDQVARTVKQHPSTVNLTFGFCAGIVDYDDAALPETETIDVMSYDSKSGVFTSLAPVSMHVVKFANAMDVASLPAPKLRLPKKTISRRQARILASLITGIDHTKWLVVGEIDHSSFDVEKSDAVRPTFTVDLINVISDLASIEIKSDNTLTFTQGELIWTGGCDGDFLRQLFFGAPLSVLRKEYDLLCRLEVA